VESPNDKVSDAYAAARELLLVAEDDAAQIRTDADRYLRRREQEAELLVAKARRVLTSAEDKAAAILARAREQAMVMLAAAESADAPAVAAAASEHVERVTVIDLVAEEVPEVERSVPAWKAEGFNPDDTGLDRILASAISNAVQRAFPTDR